MKNMLDYYLKLKSYLDSPNKASLGMSLNDVHSKGIFSLVIAGDENGRLTRVFICNKKLKPFDVQLHTHRYDLILTPLNGRIVQHTATKSLSGASMSEFSYKSPLNGGKGLSYAGECRVELNDYTLPVGSKILMGVCDYHTMSCSKGSIWVVDELGFKSEESYVLGVPFITEQLYTKPKQYQVNNACQLVNKHLNNLINAYRAVG